jgi:hypothetical protein
MDYLSAPQSCATRVRLHVPSTRIKKGAFEMPLRIFKKVTRAVTGNVRSRGKAHFCLCTILLLGPPASTSSFKLHKSFKAHHNRKHPFSTPLTYIDNVWTR